MPGAGEPLNPEVIEQVRSAWAITVRDGYGQTETTAQVGNTPGQAVRPGSMGRPLPGYEVALIDPVTGKPAEEGEICLDLSRRPLGLMTGYLGDAAQHAEAMRDGYYHTGDVAGRDADGYITYVGRTDDIFKASDYRISPFELESVLIEHEAVAEAAVVPSPDALRLFVPKAYVSLAPGLEPSPEVARSILAFGREGSRRTTGSGGSSSPTCPRPSREDPPGGTAGPGERARRERDGHGPRPRRHRRAIPPGTVPARDH